MEELFSYQNKILQSITDKWVRSAYEKIDWAQQTVGRTPSPSHTAHKFQERRHAEADSIRIPETPRFLPCPCHFACPDVVSREPEIDSAYLSGGVELIFSATAHRAKRFPRSEISDYGRRPFSGDLSTPSRWKNTAGTALPMTV